MTTQSVTKLVAVTKLLEQLGYNTSMHQVDFDRYIKRYGITVVAEMPYGRGVMRMMDHAQMEEILKREKSASIETPPSAPDLHFGALETKVDRLVESNSQLVLVVSEQTRALQLLERANNILSEKLTAVLKQLGN